MGDMRMKFAETGAGKPVEATLMVRHPNFSGMQMNQVTRDTRRRATSTSSPSRPATRRSSP